MKRPNTRQIILDTAEHVFARDGFRNATMRTITTDAGVNLASVNYYFGTKNKLLEEVLKRRIVTLNQLRSEKLESVQREAAGEGQSPTVLQIMRSFIEPVVMGLEEFGQKEKDFVSLVYRIHQEDEDTLQEIFIQLMKPTVFQFVDAFSEALPGIPKEVISIRMLFVIASMAKTFHTISHRPAMLEDLGIPFDKDTLINMLILFVTAGMEVPWLPSEK